MPQCDIILFDLAIELTSPLDLALSLNPIFELGVEQTSPLELDIEPTKEFTMVEL